MPDLSWSHILLVVIVALVVVGPKDLPKLMRTVGQWIGKHWLRGGGYSCADGSAS